MKPDRIRFGKTRWWHRLLGRGTRWEQTGLAMALLLSASLLAWLAWHLQELEQQRERLQLALDQARAPVTRPAPRPLGLVIPAEALRQMDAVTARLNVPWSDVLDVIERSATPKVALLALEPDARAGSINLTAEARSLEDLLAYAEALGQDTAVASVDLGQHDLRAQEPGQPVRMTLSISPTPFRQ